MRSLRSLFFLYAATLRALLSVAQIHNPSLLTVDSQTWAGIVGFTQFSAVLPGNYPEGAALRECG